MITKTVILDFDGTIADTRTLIVKTMRQTIAALGLPERTDGQCAAMIGLPLRQTFTGLIPMNEATGELCERTYRELFVRNNVPGAVPMFPGVGETIERMYARGLTLTIASSRSRGSLLDFLDEMRLKRYISCVVSATDVVCAKPAPDMVYEVLRHTGGTAGEALVVGDTVYDIGMGRSAGARTCGVTYGNGTQESLREADYIIDDFRRLMEIVGESGV